MDAIASVSGSFPGFALSVARLGLWLVILSVIFVPLERLFARTPAKWARPQIRNDLFYYFLSSLFPAALMALPLALLAKLVALLVPAGFHAWVHQLPVWAAIAAGLVVADIGSYWGHRFSHEWPLERWLQTVKLLESIGAKIVVAGHEGSRSGLAGKVAAQFPQSCQYVVLEPLSLVLPLIAAHSLVIAADSSLCHLAAHVGVTTIALFGPNEPAWRRPLGRQHMVVRQKVECSPCFHRKCPLDLRCQNELSYEDVANAIMLKYVCP